MSEQKYKLVPVELRSLDLFIKGYSPDCPNRDLDELINDTFKPGISIDDIRRARKALLTAQDPYAALKVAREALKKLGSHHPTCVLMKFDASRKDKCDCGLDEAIRQIDETLKGER